MSKQSKYRKKVESKGQMYGNGKAGCAHHLKAVEIHTGSVHVPGHTRMVGKNRTRAHVPARTYESIAKIPLYLLPIFTEQLTYR